MDLKNVIIFLVIFFIVLWLQYIDDKKNDNVYKRISLYDKVKIPLISACFVILIRELDYNKCINYVNSFIKSQSPNMETKPLVPQIINNNSMPSFVPKFNRNDELMNDIIMGPPDF